MSATERKFGYVKVLNEMGISHFPTEDDTDETSTLLIRTAMLPALVESMPCKSCRQCSVTIRVVNCELGMVCCLECVCTSCGEVNGSTKTSETIANSKSHVVVRSAVSATMDMGVGHAGLMKFCRYMDMPVMHHSTYHSHVKIITAASMQVANDVICEAAETVRSVHRELDPSIDTSDVIDLTVSFDGSWMTRGHKSLYGIGCVVEVVTGLVIDFAIVSLYCHMCACAASCYGGKHTRDFKRWHNTHKDCNINYVGNSGAMEVEAAEILWSRSMEKHNFRYTTVLSDGDSRTYKRLCDLDVYDGIPITKEECVNHVGKRMSTALRNLTKEKKKTGVTLGGRGHGKLTQDVIDKLTYYYSNAIRSCTGDADAMRNAVFASFFHAISTDEDPHHDRCPVGPGSWCFFQKARAKGEEPGPHKENIKTPLSRDVAEEVKNAYIRLGHPDLLRRCLTGGTQNANESLHAKVWRKCPKTGFVGLQRVIAATCYATAEFNQGFESAVARSFAAMGMKVGSHTMASAGKADAKRLRQSIRQVEESTQAARRARKVARARAHDESYQAGGF